MKLYFEKAGQDLPVRLVDNVDDVTIASEGEGAILVSYRIENLPDKDLPNIRRLGEDQEYNKVTICEYVGDGDSLVFYAVDA